MITRSKLLFLALVAALTCTCTGARIYGKTLEEPERPAASAPQLGTLSIRSVDYSLPPQYPNDEILEARRSQTRRQLREATTGIFRNSNLWEELKTDTADADWYLDVELTANRVANGLAFFTLCLFPCMEKTEINLRFSLCNPTDKTYSTIVTGETFSAFGLLGFLWRFSGGFESEDVAREALFKKLVAASLPDLEEKLTDNTGIDYGSCMPR